jgi:ribose/xylose/arabinose/galactoside ABC-type transport system permease subunit
MGSAVAKIRSAVGGIIPGRRETGGGSSASGSKGMAFVARYGTIVFLLVLVVAFTILCEIRLGEQRFLSGNNLTLLLRQSAVLAILASGLTIALILGEFDLSIAAALTLGGGIFALFLSGQYVIGRTRFSSR